MKYQEDFFGSKSDFADFVKKVVPDLFSGKLAVEGKNVGIPADRNVDYKIKYSEDEESAALTLKVSWDFGTETEEEEIELDVD
ncbi:amphi-Trp domain-containing protein [Acetivibrio mesophilus]|uniref:Amphi-Trp domain-containing protein n=1 Tax=Acetivibrio mesophilus TaxID=2487273 RepID=A0A4Q0I6K7_9FIRM|nr:amphi-Trp domain-containing protein [Acetivibrio mesophilus]ODM25080.1 transcription initiation factor IIE [Clostridium sp. Bc-iso-3]RXE59918.1 amphi-Trp domain-containing protein [Acetivibrio mesophilus]HHV29693.1 amphi-Trp domain-containing protein [Clostridium sp.]